jgi:hypothetical protein
MMAEMAFAHQTSAVSFVGTLLDVDDDRLSVRVDEVLQAPSVLGDLTGTTVTVLAPAAERSAGERYVFHVAGASYGKQLVFRAVDIAPAADRSTAPGNPRLVELTRSADLVVVGEVERVDAPRARERLTEHDPAMATAHVRVLSSVKGSAEGAVDIAVPTSADVQWQQTMSLREGSTGVFFLDRHGTAYEAIDVYPVETLESVRSLVAEL